MGRESGRGSCPVIVKLRYVSPLFVFLSFFLSSLVFIIPFNRLVFLVLSKKKKKPGMRDQKLGGVEGGGAN